jgi:hypothetical protein
MPRKQPAWPPGIKEPLTTPRRGTFQLNRLDGAGEILGGRDVSMLMDTKKPPAMLMTSAKRREKASPEWGAIRGRTRNSMGRVEGLQSADLVDLHRSSWAANAARRPHRMMPVMRSPLPDGSDSRGRRHAWTRRILIQWTQQGQVRPTRKLIIATIPGACRPHSCMTRNASAQRNCARPRNGAHSPHVFAQKRGHSKCLPGH